MALDRIGELWDPVRGGLRSVWERIELLAAGLNVDPRLLAGAGLALATAAVALLVWLVRRPGRSGRVSPVYLGGDAPGQRRKTVQSIQQTLEDLRRDDPQFVELMQMILKRCPLDRLLGHDEVEVAFGRLSFLFEKRQAAPKKRSTLLAPPENPRDLREKRAAMLTIVRCCYASDAVYSSLDEKARLQIDRFLDRLSG